MKIQFDCVFYFVSDLDRSVRFYIDVLGLRLQSRDSVARFDIDGVLLELVPSPPAGKSPQSGNARLCLLVENVEEALEELHGKGVAITPAQKKSKGVLGSFFDPDGNEICLWRYDR